MGIERKFVQAGFVKASMDEYFAKQLDMAGYGGMELNRTPMGTQIIIYSEKPGMVIGKGGKIIKKLTRDINRLYNIESPQIDVQQVKQPELNARMMATRLASSIERGWYFRKAGHDTLRAIMNAGALGCEITISGKLTGARSRVEKMVDGYIKHAGKFAEDNVDKGFATATKKLGVLGCMVRIIPPDISLPDKYYLKEVAEISEEITAPKSSQQSAVSSQQSAVKSDDLIELIKSEPITNEVADMEEVGSRQSAVGSQATNEVVDEVEIEVGKSDAEYVGEDSREIDGTHQHKHDKHEYWHPVARVHKEK